MAKDDLEFNASIAASAPPGGRRRPSDQSCLDRIDTCDIVMFIVGFIVIAASFGFVGLYVTQKITYTQLAALALGVSSCPDSPSCIASAARILTYTDPTVAPCTDFYSFSCGGFKNKHYSTDFYSGVTSVSSLLNDQRATELAALLIGQRSTSVNSLTASRSDLKASFNMATTYYRACSSTIGPNILNYVSNTATQSAQVVNNTQIQVISYIQNKIIGLDLASNSSLMVNLHVAVATLSPNTFGQVRELIGANEAGIFSTGPLDFMIYPRYNPSISPVVAFLPPILTFEKADYVTNFTMFNLTVYKVAPVMQYYVYPSMNLSDVLSLTSDFILFENQLKAISAGLVRPTSISSFNLVSVSDLQTRYPNIMGGAGNPNGWATFFNLMQFPAGLVSASSTSNTDFMIHVSSDSYMSQLDTLLANVNRATFKNYLAWISLLQLGAISQMHGVPIYGIKFDGFGSGFQAFSSLKKPASFAKTAAFQGGVSKSGLEIGDHLKGSFVATLSNEQFSAVRNLISANPGASLETLMASAVLETITTNVCVKDTVEKFPLVIGRFYANYMVSSSTSDMISTVATNVKNAWMKRLNTPSLEPWLDDASRTKALNKLSRMSTIIGFPYDLDQPGFVDNFYSGVQLSSMSSTDFFTNALQTVSNMNLVQNRMWTSKLSMVSLSLTQDWTAVNAFYAFTFNTLVMPMGFMQSTVVSTADPIPILYGSLGSIIGHEMSHAFDPTGIQYDEYGNSNSLLSSSALMQYNTGTSCFASYFQKFTLSGIAVNGTRTLADNVADNGGLLVSWDAYAAANGTRVVRLPGLTLKTDDQLFWLGYSQLWCSVIDNSNFLYSMLADVHTIAQTRVNAGLSLNPNFASSWKCPASSAMVGTGTCTLF